VSGRPVYVPALVAMTLLAASAEFRFRYEPTPAQGDAGWLIGDCVAYRDIARSLLTYASVDYQLVNPREARRFAEAPGRTRTATRSTVSLTRDGRLVPKHPVLFPLALALPYALLREPGLLLFNWAQCTLLVVLVYRLARRFVPDPAAFAAAATFLADGILRNYTYNVSPDVFSAVLLLGGTLWVWEAGSARAGLLAGGFVLGLAVWMRPVNLVGLAALLPAAAASFRARAFGPRLALPLAGFAAGVSGYLLLNGFWFGDPFTTPYDRIVVLNDGVRSTVSHRSDMHRPFWSSLLPTLVTHKQSFLQTAPHWPLVLPCLAVLARRRTAEALALAALVFGQALFLVKYDHWLLSHFGNRFLMLPAAVSALGVAWLVQALATRSGDCLAREPPPARAG
jgi:hypothetical protein